MKYFQIVVIWYFCIKDIFKWYGETGGKSGACTSDFREERFLFRKPVGGVRYAGRRPDWDQEKHAFARWFDRWKYQDDQASAYCGLPSY